MEYCREGNKLNLWWLRLGADYKLTYKFKKSAVTIKFCGKGALKHKSS